MFDSEQYLKAHAKQVTTQRLKLLRQLVQKPWFQATDKKLQDEIARLPQEGKENHDGFILDLIRRKSEIGGIHVLRLLSLNRGNFILVPVFEVMNKRAGITYTYEYSAFRHGVPAGSKGIIFVREHRTADPTHIIILSCEKFATAETTYDLIGGLPKEESGYKHELIDAITRDVREETGVQTLEIDEVKILGNLLVDPGMTNHESRLFAAFITPQEAAKISDHAKNVDDLEPETFVHMFPLTDLARIASKTNNSMFLAAIAKSLVAGIIPKRYCSESILPIEDGDTVFSARTLPG